MKYLKLVNCPVRGLFPEKSGKIDWAGCGFDITKVSRFSCQGEDSAGNYISLFPISDENKLVASGVIDKTNGNDNPGDTAEIVDDISAVRTELETVRAAKKAAIT
jgi:hypothetical protein